MAIRKDQISVGVLEHQADSPAFSSEHIMYGHGAKVLQRIALRRELIKAGRIKDADKIRPLVFFEGGGHAVSWEIGVAEEMHKRGFFDGAVKWVFGASAGSLVATNGVTGNIEATGLILANCENGFADLRNFFNPDIRAFVHFSGHLQRLRELFPVNREKLKSSLTEVIALIMGRDTGEVEAVSLNNHPDPEQVLMASCNIPFVGDIKSVEIDGKRYNDGALRGIPVELLRSYNPTDILIITSSPYTRGRRQRNREAFLEKLSHIPMPDIAQHALSSLHRGHETRREVLRMNLERNEKNQLYVGLMSPIRSDIGTLTMDADKIEETLQASRASARKLFTRVLGE